MFGDIQITHRPVNSNTTTLDVRYVSGDAPSTHPSRQYVDLMYQIDFACKFPDVRELALGRALQELGKQIEERAQMRIDRRLREEKK